MQLTPARTGAANLGQPLTVGGEFLHPVIAMVGHVHVTRAVYRDAPGTVELAVSAAFRAPTQQELAVIAELANLVAATVGQINVPLASRARADSAWVCPSSFSRALHRRRNFSSLSKMVTWFSHSSET